MNDRPSMERGTDLNSHLWCFGCFMERTWCHPVKNAHRRPIGKTRVPVRSATKIRTDGITAAIANPTTTSRTMMATKARTIFLNVRHLAGLKASTRMPRQKETSPIRTVADIVGCIGSLPNLCGILYSVRPRRVIK